MADNFEEEKEMEMDNDDEEVRSILCFALARTQMSQK